MLKLDMKNEADKQKVMAIGLIIVIIAAAFFVLKPMLFSGDDSAGSAEMAPSEAVPVESAPAPSAPNPAVAPDGSANPTAATAPAPAASPAPASTPSAATAAPASKTITVFGSVVVTYPDGWGIGLASAGSAAVLTNGKAKFEVHAPDPRANSAKAIADSALKSLSNGGRVVSQGAIKVAGFDSYQYTLGSMKIIGVDAPMRIVIVESAKNGSVSTYRAAFDKMESELKFQ